MRAAVLESKIRTRSQIRNGTRDKNLVRTGCITDARRRMHGDASQITVGQQLDLARVQSAPHLHSEDVHAEGDLASGMQCVAREVESDQMAVSGLFDDSSLMQGDALGNVCAEIFHDTRPTDIAHLRGLLRRAHDVGE